MAPFRKILHTLFPLIFLAGCSTISDNPKDYQPSSSTPGTGQVILYRTTPRSTPGFWQHFYLDGGWEGEIRPDRHYCFNTHVGRHIVRVGGTDSKLEFSLEKGQQVFIRFDVDGDTKGKPFPIYPVMVDRQTANKEFGGTTSDIGCPPIAP